ncbi:hypothetical protein AV530_002418 [Patagioenas fasciata monilis]|uniref:Uncharacterized protein n=1 Tax=Patagioenas fasciata monilis TaxID=372326 RepID=A0A1V4K6C1_PATFA|nr:hypothetical protein AV530_002418 [Patagioenas fasciata monilis]
MHFFAIGKIPDGHLGFPLEPQERNFPTHVILQLPRQLLFVFLAKSCISSHTSISATNKMVALILYHDAFIRKNRCKTHTAVSNTKCFGDEPIAEDAYR